MIMGLNTCLIYSLFSITSLNPDWPAEGAWDITKGNPNSIIGLIDDGLDKSHPDLQGKVIGGDNS
jgi:hypothetical protein